MFSQGILGLAKLEFFGGDGIVSTIYCTIFRIEFSEESSNNSLVIFICRFLGGLEWEIGVFPCRKWIVYL